MGAVSDIKKAEEYSKKPPLFKKFFKHRFYRGRQVLWAKKKAEDMREELKNLISFTRGPVLGKNSKRKQIFAKKQQAIYDQKKDEENSLKLLW